MNNSDVKTPAIFSSGSHSTVGKTGGCMSGEVFFDPLVLSHPFTAACCSEEGAGPLLTFFSE